MRSKDEFDEFYSQLPVVAQGIVKLLMSVGVVNQNDASGVGISNPRPGTKI